MSEYIHVKFESRGLDSLAESFKRLVELLERTEKKINEKLDEEKDKRYGK